MEVEGGKEGNSEISSNGKRGESDGSIRRVVRFIEKPTRSRAEEFLASGRFFWNAGIFVFRTSYLFEEMERACPDILKVARRAHAARKAGDSSSFTEIFSSSPSLSIDVAVMEKARQVLTVPCACGWSDLGSWEAVFEFRGGTSAGNILEGPAEAVDGSGNLVLAEARPVRVVGLSDVVVVESPDGLLVMRRGASDALRRSVEEGLKR
jgi:mannose-1-phosphate guanylyltransferase